MAYEFSDNVSLSLFELQNFRIQQITVRPANALSQIIYNTTTNTPEIFDGTAWVSLDARKATNIPLSALSVDPLARANHTGFQTASTISNFDAQVRTSRLDQMAAPTASVSLNSQLIVALAAGTTAGQAVEYNQFITGLDQARQAVRTKPSVRGVFVSNVALTGIPTATDGLTLTAGDEWLAAGQTNQTQNGPYVIAAGAWTRRLADDQGAELQPGAEWFVREGAVYAASKWVIRNLVAPVVGTDNILISQSGAATSYTASNGVQIVGSDIRGVVVASGGLTVSAGGFALDLTVAARKFSVTYGDGTASSYTITHNLGTLDIVASARRLSDNKIIGVTFVAATVNTATVTHGAAVALNSFRATITG